MKIINESTLLETDLLAGRKIDWRNNKKIKSNILEVTDVLKNYFGESKYNTYLKSPGIDTLIIQDIMLNEGADDVRNNGIKLMKAVTESGNKPLDAQSFMLAKNLLDQKYLRLEDNDWLLDGTSYEPLYKAKTLAFLSNADARKYGDNPEAAKLEILKANDEQTIKKFMSAWQSKSPDNAKTPILQTLLKKDAELRNSFEKSSGEFSDDNLIKLLNNVNTNTSSPYGDLIKLFADALKENLNENLKYYLIEDSYISPRYFKIKKNELVKLLKLDEVENEEEAEEIILTFLDNMHRDLYKNNNQSQKDNQDNNTQKSSDNSQSGNSGEKILLELQGLDQFTEDSTAVDEFRKYVNKSGIKEVFSSSAPIDDFLSIKSNVENLLNAQYTDKQSFIDRIKSTLVDLYL